MTRYTTRIHEAPAIPCAGCGAALPIDPTAHHVWCPYCRAWHPVPDQLWQRAHEYLQATARARDAEAAHRGAASREWEVARQKQRMASPWQWALAGVFLMTVPGTAVVMIRPFWQWLSSLPDTYETWALVLGTVVGGAASLALGLGFLSAGYGMYRLLTRHRRRAQERDARDWYAADPGHTAGALCGVCGGPLAFQVGEAAVTCGFCRNVVVATSRHKRRLIQLALHQAQIAVLERARAARAALLADLQNQRSRTVYITYVYAGMLMCAALPVAAAAYAWRTLSPSLEQALLDLADTLSGEFTAGQRPAFEWLDAFWLASTPSPLLSATAFQSRWNIEAVFHERPLLLSVTSGWSDRVAQSAALLLARPGERPPEVVARALASSSAARVRALGFEPTLDYAGACLAGANLKSPELGRDQVTQLAQAAYELAEYRDRQ